MKSFKNTLVYLINEQLSQKNVFPKMDIDSDNNFVTVEDPNTSNIYKVYLVNGVFPDMAPELEEHFSYYIGKKTDEGIIVPVNERAPYWIRTMSLEDSIEYCANEATVSMVQANYYGNLNLQKYVSENKIRLPRISHEVIDKITGDVTRLFEKIFETSNTDDVENYMIKVYPDFENPWRATVYVQIGYPESGQVYDCEGTSFFLTFDPIMLGCYYSEEFPWMSKEQNLWSLDPTSIALPRVMKSALQILANDTLCEFPEDYIDRLKMYTESDTNFSTKAETARKFVLHMASSIIKNFPSSKNVTQDDILEKIFYSMGKNGVTRICIGAYVIVDAVIDYGLIYDIGIKPDAKERSWDAIFYECKMPNRNDILIATGKSYKDMGYEPYSDNLSIECKSILQDIGDICVDIFREMEEER